MQFSLPVVIGWLSTSIPRSVGKMRTTRVCLDTSGRKQAAGRKMRTNNDSG